MKNQRNCKLKPEMNSLKPELMDSTRYDLGGISNDRVFHLFKSMLA